MNKGIIQTKQHYEEMMYKEVVKTGFYEFQVCFCDLITIF